MKRTNRIIISLERNLSHPTSTYFCDLPTFSASKEEESSLMSSFPCSLWVLKLWRICVALFWVFFTLLGPDFEAGILLNCGDLDDPGRSKAVSLISSPRNLLTFAPVAFFFVGSLTVAFSFVASLSFPGSFCREVPPCGSRMWDKKLSKYRAIVLSFSCFRLPARYVLSSGHLSRGSGRQLAATVANNVSQVSRRWTLFLIGQRGSSIYLLCFVNIVPEILRTSCDSDSTEAEA